MNNLPNSNFYDFLLTVCINIVYIVIKLFTL